MTKDSVLTRPERVNLSVIEKPRPEQAKLISLKKTGQKPKEDNMPPVQEQYIKAKKHDFL